MIVKSAFCKLVVTTVTPGREKNLDIVREQHLHAQSSGVESEIFDIETVFSKNLLFVTGPEHRMNRGRKPTARRAQVFCRWQWARQQEKKGNDTREIFY